MYTRTRTKQKFGQWYLSGAASVVCVQIAFTRKDERWGWPMYTHVDCPYIWRIQWLYVAGKTWMLSGFRGDLSKLPFPNRPPQLCLLRHQLVMGFRWGCTDAPPSFKVYSCVQEWRYLGVLEHLAGRIWPHWFGSSTFWLCWTFLRSWCGCRCWKVCSGKHSWRGRCTACMAKLFLYRLRQIRAVWK